MDKQAVEAIQRAIAESLNDMAAGRVRGPFRSGQAMGESVEAAIVEETYDRSHAALLIKKT